MRHSRVTARPRFGCEMPTSPGEEMNTLRASACSNPQRVCSGRSSRFAASATGASCSAERAWNFRANLRKRAAGPATGAEGPDMTQGSLHRIGIMGEAMTRRLLDRGHAVTVWTSSRSGLRP